MDDNDFPHWRQRHATEEANLLASLLLDDAIRFLTQAILLFTALWTLADFVRRGGRERAVIAAMFGTLGITTLISWGTDLTATKPVWLSSFSVIALLGHPLLMVLVVHHFRRVKKWFLMCIGAAWILSTIAYIFTVTPDQAQLPAPATLLIVAYFGLGELYAAYAFVYGAAKSRGVAQKRLVFAAAGAGLLGLVLLLAGVNALLTAGTRIPAFATGILGLVSILAFYVGFSPPSWLRRFWLQAEIARFVTEQSNAQGVADRAARSTSLMANAALALASGHHGGIAIASPTGWKVQIRESTSTAGEFTLSGAAGKQLSAWLEQERPEPLIPIDEAVPALRELMAPQAQGWLLSVPMIGALRSWGLVLVAMDRPPLFIDETVETLKVLASQACTAYEVESAEAEITAANRELEAFAYTVSHDLRAPLRSMDGFSRILLSEFGEALSAEARHNVDMIVDGAREMGQMVDDLLRFSRLGKQELNRQEIHTGALVAQVANELRAHEPRRDLEFQLGELPPCHADAGLLKQVFVNLMGNAAKYTRQKHPAKIELGWTEEHGGAFFVKDNGVGFYMSHAHNMFGVFQRLHRAEDFEGTGVGLAIVRRIVNRHGGRIWAQAEVDKGATFFFTLHGGTTQ